MRKLTLDDITDVRAYERERDEFRHRIIGLKKRRRIALGDLMTLVFENTDTMRFQVQEMARIERIASDEGIQHELDTYNQLIPDPGELSATLLIELTNDQALREWLPKLVGVQRAVRIELPQGMPAVPGVPQDEERLTRDELTSTVHYLKFPVGADQAAALAQTGARVVVDHPEYHSVTELTAEQRTELASDLV